MLKNNERMDIVEGVKKGKISIREAVVKLCQLKTVEKLKKEVKSINVR